MDVSEEEKQQLALHVLKKFRIIYGSVRQHFREVEQTCGVSGSKLWIMQEIANEPGIGVTALAGRLSIHQSICSQLIEKLVSKERSKEDQRRVGLQLSAAAVELMKVARVRLKACCRRRELDVGSIDARAGYRAGRGHQTAADQRRAVRGQDFVRPLAWKGISSTLEWRTRL